MDEKENSKFIIHILKVRVKKKRIFLLIFAARVSKIDQRKLFLKSIETK